MVESLIALFDLPGEYRMTGKLLRLRKAISDSALRYRKHSVEEKLESVNFPQVFAKQILLLGSGKQPRLT